jgi:hypothetical protein
MLRTCKASTASDGRSGAARRGWCAALLVLPVLLGACQHQDGIVGSEPLVSAPDASAADSGAADSGGQTPTYFTDFDAIDDWQPDNSLPGSSTNFGVQITGATDPSTAELRFPGHPEYAATDNMGADYVTQIASPQKFGFGTYRTRVQLGSCKPTEDAVNAALGFFNDGTDANQNGITDDLEIDFQVLCGTPQNLYLTVFTDYESDTQFRKLSHLIDFSTGTLYDTPSAEKDGFTKTSTVAAFLRPELFDSTTFYEIGFEWHTASLRFFMVLDGADVTLWTLTDPTHIPQRPVTFLYNLWHPAAHWFPSTSAADFPANDVVMHVDWFEFFAEQ